MGTLFEKFPGVKREAIRILPVSVAFRGVLSAGKFVFNSKQDFYLASVGDRLVLDGIELAADIDQLEFSRAIVAPFRSQLWRSGNNTPVLQQPFVFSAFNQGRNFAADWSPTTLNGSNEMIQISMDGELNQTAALSGLSEVNIFGTASLYVVSKV